jgi:threonyl-tRNA synthetase
MVLITLPDKSQKQFEHSVSVKEVAEAIGAGLAKAAIAGKVNDKLVDLSFIIENDSNIRIITEKDPESLDIIRHSCAHLLAQAVKILFPTAQVTIGPVIEDGFYYDFAFERTFTPEDLEKIEHKMHALAEQNFEVKRFTLPRDEAIEFFKKQGEVYKAKIIQDIPSNEILSLYQQGGFTDLCRGPHVPNTGKIKAFKLTKLAGAYWRGDAKNEMLQRIYGTAWLNKKDLDQYLHQLEEAEKRDHRKIAKNLDLFHIQDDAQGMIFWHPDGWVIYQAIEQYMRQTMREYGYLEVRTPQLLDKTLWEKSGHWEMYGKNMFVTESENKTYAIKPMSCPAHVQIFNQGLKSYRDLPLRLAEFGCCHRNEASGALHGLMRTRCFSQDDAHIFCMEPQIQHEAIQCIDLITKVYADFEFHDIHIKLATRPVERIGDDALWDRAESMLENALKSKKVSYEMLPGEGAFYGPKLEFHLKDSIGRMWQCGTFQVDYSQPSRLGAEYISEDGSRKIPVMLHQAIYGSLERFIAIVIENCAGYFPLWLAPIQCVVMNITDNQQEYTQKIADKLKKYGFRVKLDLRNEKIGFKIREHTLKRVPYQIILGEKEKSSETLSVRTLSGKDLGSMVVEEFGELLKQKISARSKQELDEGR